MVVLAHRRRQGLRRACVRGERPLVEAGRHDASIVSMPRPSDRDGARGQMVRSCALCSTTDDVTSGATCQEGIDERLDPLREPLRDESLADQRPGPHEVHGRRQYDRCGDILGQLRRGSQLRVQRG